MSGVFFPQDHELRVINVPPPPFRDIHQLQSLATGESAPTDEMVPIAIPSLLPLSATATECTPPLPPTSNISAAVAGVALVDVSVSEYKPLLAWDQSISDPSLKYHKQSSTAFRPGNVSCYPAALINVPKDYKSSLTAVLDSCPFANNTMSFGIAVKGFPKSGQQAVGERQDSWGILNNRSEPSVDEPSKVLLTI